VEQQNETGYLCLLARMSYFLIFPKLIHWFPMLDDFTRISYDCARRKAYPPYSATFLQHTSVSLFIKCVIFVQSIIYCYTKQLIFPVKGILFLPLSLLRDVPSSTYRICRKTLEIS
jgi:hypothetical protein